ncbi:hypothetical protein [uncultured Psychrobacter sp.]|uniref:hypothetical protein n=1 Tax=uncultured Psychrobacter sp. TaxID=259303 RepID=UPI0030DCAC87
MRITKHIQAIGADLQLPEMQTATLQQVWNDRDKSESILITEVSASKDYSRRDFKVIICYKGEFTDITKLVAQVSDNKYKDGAVQYNGGNSNAPIELLLSLFDKLAPSNCKERIIRLKAPTQPWQL